MINDGWSVSLPAGERWDTIINNAEATHWKNVFLVANWYFPGVRPVSRVTASILNGYRIPHAATADFFPSLWRTSVKGGNNLGLREPAQSEFDRFNDLEVTLTVPVPLGDYRVIKNQPGDAEGVVRLLVSMPTEGMEPRTDDILSFSPGGTIHGPYVVLSCEPALPVVPKPDRLTHKQDSEVRPAAILTVKRHWRKPPKHEAAPGSQIVGRLLGEADARKKNADPANTWERRPPLTTAQPDTLLDNIRVLHRWKGVLDDLPETTGRRLDCPCPIVHHDTCTDRQTVRRAVRESRAARCERCTSWCSSRSAAVVFARRSGRLRFSGGLRPTSAHPSPIISGS